MPVFRTYIRFEPKKWTAIGCPASQIAPPRFIAGRFLYQPAGGSADPPIHPDLAAASADEVRARAASSAGDGGAGLGGAVRVRARV